MAAGAAAFAGRAAAAPTGTASSARIEKPAQNLRFMGPPLLLSLWSLPGRDRQLITIGPLVKAPVIEPDVREAQDVFQGKIGVRRLLALTAIDDDRLVGRHADAAVFGGQFLLGLPAAVSVQVLDPRMA